MPIKKEAEPIYRIAHPFRQRCLAEGQSLLWPEHRVWTPQNISALWHAFIEKPETGKRSFFDKWHNDKASAVFYPGRSEPTALGAFAKAVW